MRIDDEMHMLALRRVYCYLRLCGVPGEEALKQLRGQWDAFTDSAAGTQTEALLETAARSGIRLPSPAPLPPIRRGHVHCP